ncbi:type 1 glutamine amidotransferase domain-containing protein [Arachidicoccus terrestris]|uniref:type 1 glutamine amidotransferase domain-containing protein n=1 Tax=Arachidicoccus terrestris TaxID=2875539 RepID=UPI001CC756DE|nr:type 1 glutamine amidotransferase domain-containing protein [Arachidicoccus terrestris]UAY55431.1 type 1 glutamine amidotransferase domain-containing protein [Arachidicoccus terrestris]
MKILIIVTNVDRYASGQLPTGLWLSELTHIYHSATGQGYKITIASPRGGNTPIDPESLKPFVLDKVSKQYFENRGFMALLEQTAPLDGIADPYFDCVYLTGGHGTMYDFPDDIHIQAIIKDQYENNRLVAAICHGVGGLLNVKLSDGEYLLKGKTITGFDWFEETIARRKKEVPFNLEAALKARGVHYKKAFIPMTSNVVVDGHLITGQNPFSSKQMAKVVMEQLNR